MSLVRDSTGTRSSLPYPGWGTLRAMEVHFTPEQEARIAQIATKAGSDSERLVKYVVVRYLNDEARFLTAVEKGLAAADRGGFIEEEEMDARIERMFSKP